MNGRSVEILLSHLPLPPPPKPRGCYDSVVIHAGVAYASGQVSRRSDQVIRGPARADTSPDLIQQAAQSCIANALSALDHALGGLDRIERFLFVRGFIAATPDFTDHSKLLDHASEILTATFGERGRHARSVVGVSSLPGGGLLEIELVAALKR